MSSAAVSIFTYPFPPPTTNTLDSHQRARLIRSTRKLGSLLGTTPFLLEGDATTVLPAAGNTRHTSKALKRQGSIFNSRRADLAYVASHSPTSSAASSVSSLVSCAPDSASGRQSLELPSSGVSKKLTRQLSTKSRPLYLRLNVVPVSPSDTRSVPPSPITCPSTGDSPLSPCSPAASVPDPAEMRRKRVAKLSRHLGENIPPELVPAPEAHPIPRSSHTQSPPKKSASTSCVIPKDVPFAPVEVLPSQHVWNQDWVGQWNRSDMQEVQRELRNLKAQ
ncbi:hypothetical protein F5J12DRAFT_850404 [Pisolithus orientalis]|uniref:uncharacterized protein n=1 Tax=Pisolithus orientalis TaxID=936130 RepID=UPI002224B206|nr:uncharacterized protein F5J12DRAFT_850404 [Pisolithus orientalis]KAI5997795.1 hypothetical protein F5J12DRAFT_850404 [Pisolithus orientalis]